MIKFTFIISNILWFALSLQVKQSQAASSLSQSQPIITYDEYKMPRCVARGRHNEGFLLFWNHKSLYQRDVYAIKLNWIQHFLPNVIISCDMWPKLTKWAKQNGYKKVVPDKASHIYGYELDYTFQRALHQLRNGANVYHSEITGTEFLTNHPIINFDNDLNLTLTYQYGAGFAGAIYKAWLENDSLSQRFQEQVLQSVRNTDNNATISLKDKYRGITVAFVHGYMQSPNNNRLGPVIEQLTQSGINVTVLKTDTMAPPASNYASLKDQLSKLFATSDKVILVGACKGVVDLLYTLTDFSDAIDSSQNVLAIISFAGMASRGSFIIDWAFSNSLIRRKMVKILRNNAEQEGLIEPGSDYDLIPGLTSMTSKYINNFYALNGGRLPQTPTYVNVVGIIPGNGLAADPTMRALQAEITRWQIGFHGANDGYIEYPGTGFGFVTMKPKLNIVFSATHTVLDGKYDDYDMRDEKKRQLVIHALFANLIDFL